MPGQICAVSSCKSNRTSFKKNGTNIAFHSFPKGNDLVSSTLRNEWIKRCTRKEKFNLKTSKICSLHFKPSDYERDLRNELLGLRLRRILKKNVVPTLNLNDKCEELAEKSVENTSHKIAGKKKNKNPVESLHTDTGLSNPESSQLLDVPSTSTAVPSLYIEVLNNLNTSSVPDTYKEKYENLLLKYNQFRYNSYKKIKLLNSMRKYYKMKYYRSINKVSKSIMAETALKDDACEVLDLLLTIKKEKS